MSLAAIRARTGAQLLTGRTAVVVGGTSGIGEGIAVRLAQARASVMIVGRNAEQGAAVVARMVRPRAAVDPRAPTTDSRLSKR